MRLRLLGPVDIFDEVNGRRIDLTGAKRRALLATLVVRQGQTISLHRLTEELWGERPPANAVNALQAHVARLRKLLSVAGGSPDQIVTQSSGYSLDLEPGQTDVDEFNRLSAQAREVLADRPERAIELLRAALDLWRGPAFDGNTTGEILATEAELLTENRLATLESLYDASLRIGRHREVVGEIEETIAAHPLRERFYDQLMVALYRCHRQSEAIGVYDRARRKLLRELGVEPGPALRGRMQAILAHSPSLLLPASEESDVDGLSITSIGDLNQELAHLQRRMNTLARRQEQLMRMVAGTAAVAGL
ncbi:AfsR/SARP family transcriptional regulator [Kutzneria chonburiensis]|uniref:BTAD domain-containing putative transcriptional regulator n=1 Tax=Kutzneria chonburiensis TaxID=1483604 RepID=A0ABV6N6U1_9PSEU|nr:AfsR/SARP family transcriptional regulator [Kutzneria chonburiensis]